MVDQNSADLLSLITPNQAAGILGVKVTTLTNWRCTGAYRLPFVKVGRRVMYRQHDIEEFIEKRARDGHNYSEIT